MEPHTPLRRGPGAGSGANLVRALASYLVDPALEVSKSTSADGSPHTSSKHTTRVQLKSPFRDMVAPDSAEQATNTTNIPMVDLDSAQPAGSAAAASTGAASAAAAAAVAEACPSLLLPYPHRRPATINVLHDLQSRQCRTVGVSPVSFKRRTRGHQFGRFELRRSASTFDAVAAAPPELELVNLQKKSKIMEIVSAGNFVFALTHAGVCVAFDNRTMKRLCYLNIISDEVIRSLFHNKVNQSLITVSVYRHDNFTSLRCRSTPFEAIRQGKPELGLSLFESESLQWPGFVEFDDVNKKVLTFSAMSKKYKIWDLSNYRLMYDMSNPLIEEVKISPGIMLLILKRSASSIPLKIVAIDTGEVLQELHHPLAKGVKLQFIEQFNEKLLVKQRKQPMHMIDVHDERKSRVISEGQFATPSAFIFLYENHFFLTFSKREIAVWNFSGQRVAEFEDHYNWWPDCNTNNIYINSSQDLLISYCLTPEQAAALQRRDADPTTWKKLKRRTGSVNVSNIFTGRCVAKIEKRRQLKYPFHMLSTQQQQTAIADYKRTYGKGRLRQVMPGETMVDSAAASPALHSAGSDPVARAIELQQEERSLQMLLHLNAQEQQQLHHTPVPITAASAPPATAHPPGDTAMEVDDQLDDDDDDDDDSAASSDHSSDGEREVDELERLEQQGHMSASRVLFPMQSAVAPQSCPRHQLAAIDADLTDLDAYRAYNRRVRARNAALKDITAVYFNEERNEIYTGNRAGKLHVWTH